MPIETIELVKLIGGIFALIIPGYLWSYLFSENIEPLERFVFGFLLGLGVLCFGPFMLDVVFGLPITQNKILVLLATYTIPIIIMYIVSISKYGLAKPNLNYFKNPKFILLILILAFSVFMISLPHWSDHYFLPFHVDEWIHWSYSKSVIESGSSSFINPYTGGGVVQSLELGFHFIIASINWFTGSNFVTVFVFMPSIIAVFVGLTAFNIGERAERKFGLEAAFLVSFIPTTCRFLGPSFFVPVALGLLFIAFLIWLGALRKLSAALLIPFFIWCTFLIHPPTALAALIIIFSYALLLILEKEYKLTIITIVLSLIPIAMLFLLATRWDYSLQQVIDAFFGGKQFLRYHLPKIWTSFDHLGVVTWILCIVGAYFAFSRGKVIQRTMTISAIVIIMFIGLYDKLNYGLPIFYERGFLFLFLLVAMVAGYGLSEIRKIVKINSGKIIPKPSIRIPKNIGITVPIFVCILLMTTAVPAHLDIPYYQMIDEEEYRTFTWIQENIDKYRDENHRYDRAAVNPFFASPFSAVTRLYILTSSMHPLHSYSLYPEMKKFLNNQCVNTSFLDKYEISVVYGKCNNDNLTKIHPNVYLYPGLYAT
ncbi:MAG: hypothetical protein ACOC80_15445 [Petrotogales bacterium]